MRTHLLVTILTVCLATFGNANDNPQDSDKINENLNNLCGMISDKSWVPRRPNRVRKCREIQALLKRQDTPIDSEVSRILYKTMFPSVLPLRTKTVHTALWDTGRVYRIESWLKYSKYDDGAEACPSGQIYSCLATLVAEPQQADPPLLGELLSC